MKKKVCVKSQNEHKFHDILIMLYFTYTVTVHKFHDILIMLYFTYTVTVLFPAVYDETGL
jgi:uncharacterized membrane protein